MYLSNVFNCRVKSAVFPVKLKLPRLFHMLRLAQKIPLPITDQHQFLAIIVNSQQWPTASEPIAIYGVEETSFVCDTLSVFI